MPFLDWVGKDKVINHHLDVPFRVLNKIYSYDENGCHNDGCSENMIIHGDNLEALKALLPKYEGRIKCVYIDPPYNTGNEGWVYNDNVNDERIQKWLNDVVGKEGDDLTRHDKWLCMMYPRLRLLHRLMSNESAIFISIDDNEISYLKLIMDEIFGASNFVAQITLLCNPKGRSQDKYFATCHEYLLVYTKRAVPAGFFSVEKNEKKIDSDYKLSDEAGKYRLIELRNTHREFGKENRPNLYYPIYVNKANGTVSLERSDEYSIQVYPNWADGYEGCWTWGTELAQKDNHLLVAKKSKNTWKIYRKSYAITDEGVALQKLFTIWNDPSFYTEKGQVVFGSIFPGTNKNDFPQPKSIEYVAEAIRTITHDGDIVLDSFAGSGSTGHSVLSLNNKDGQNRHFILIEREEYANTFTAERIKRVISGYGEGAKSVVGTGGDFSYYELGEPLMVNDSLNKNISVNKINEYIYYMETKNSLPEPKSDEPFYLGSYKGIAYYFYYSNDSITTLNRDFLNTIKTKADGYVIYSDVCTLSDSELDKYHITFKKIPRDIVKL